MNLFLSLFQVVQQRARHEFSQKPDFIDWYEPEKIYPEDSQYCLWNENVHSDEDLTTSNNFNEDFETAKNAWGKTTFILHLN